MTSFNKKLAQAKRAGRPSKDVTFALRSDIQARRVQLQEQVDALTSRAATERQDAETDRRLSAGPVKSSVADELTALIGELGQLDVDEADSLVTLRFWQLPGSEWARLMSEHVDDTDTSAAAILAAQVNGRVVDGGKLLTPSADQWADLWDQMDGSAYMTVVNTIYELNATDGMERVARLGKVSARTPAPSAGSPA